LSLDLAYDDGQEAIRDALAHFCRERCDDRVVKAAAGSFPAELWRDLAGLGVLAAATPEGEGGALEVTAAMEALGACVFPGPLVASFLAGQVLEPDARRAVSRGEILVAAGRAPWLPWAPRAGIFLEVEGERVFRARPRGEVEAVETLGGEPWGRVGLEREAELSGAERGLALAQIALAAYLAAAGARLVADASEHARTRVQFGRPIGDFQAVAHPLADCHIRLSAAAALARAAAFQLDAGAPAAARSTAAAARLSAGAAALEAGYVAHQVFGAVGITLEGPVFHVSRKIRQLASWQAPGEDLSRAVLLESVGDPGAGRHRGMGKRAGPGQGEESP